MAERPKTVGLMQDVFAADGDMGIKGAGFLRASDRKVPAGKCRISKGG